MFKQGIRNDGLLTMSFQGIGHKGSRQPVSHYQELTFFFMVHLQACRLVLRGSLFRSRNSLFEKGIHLRLVGFGRMPSHPLG